MSFQNTQPDVQVVVCDICHAESWVGDPQWRPMLHGSAAAPIHLCPKCRLTAEWCDTHKQYHPRDAAHRRGCVDCGGLFTSVVRHHITRCPACQRAVGDYPPPPAPAQSERPRSFLQRLFSSGVSR